MAFLTNKERAVKIRACSRLLSDLKRVHNNLAALEKSHEYASDLGQNEKIAGVQEMLDDCANIENDLATALAAIDWNYTEDIKIGQESGFTSVDIDADNGASKAEITANGGAPFEALTAGGQTVEILDAEDSENVGNGTTYTVDATTTSTVLVLTAVLSGGVDNTDDERFHLVRRT